MLFTVSDSRSLAEWELLQQAPTPPDKPLVLPFTGTKFRIEIRTFRKSVGMRTVVQFVDDVDDVVDHMQLSFEGDGNHDFEFLGDTYRCSLVATGGAPGKGVPKVPRRSRQPSPVAQKPPPRGKTDKKGDPPAISEQTVSGDTKQPTTSGLTPAEYVAEGGRRCPLCGSNHIRKTVALPEDTASRRVYCRACTGRWVEHVGVVGVSEIAPGPGKVSPAKS